MSFHHLYWVRKQHYCKLKLNNSSPGMNISSSISQLRRLMHFHNRRTHKYIFALYSAHYYMLLLTYLSNRDNRLQFKDVALSFSYINVCGRVCVGMCVNSTAFFVCVWVEKILFIFIFPLCCQEAKGFVVNSTKEQQIKCLNIYAVSPCILSPWHSVMTREYYAVKNANKQIFLLT